MKKLLLVFLAVLLAVLSVSCEKDGSISPDRKKWLYDNGDDFSLIVDLSTLHSKGKCIIKSVEGSVKDGQKIYYNPSEDVFEYHLAKLDGEWVMKLEDEYGGAFFFFYDVKMNSARLKGPWKGDGTIDIKVVKYKAIAE